MSIASIPPLISAVAFLLLGGFILSRNLKSAANKSFFLVCLCTVWWQFSWFILFNITDLFWINILVRVGYLGIILIPVTFFHFFINFLEIKSKAERRLLYLFYFLAVLFQLSLFLSDYFVAGSYTYSFGHYPKVGLLHLGWLTLLGVIFCRLIYLAIVAMKNKREIGPYKYYQIKYLALALVFYAFASVDFLANYGIEMYPFGFIFIIIFLGIVGYAIFRYRLMDIRIIAQKIFLYLSAAIFSTLAFYFIAWCYLQFFGGIFTSQTYLASIFVAPIFVIFFYFLIGFSNRLVSKYIFHGLYNYQETFSGLVKQLSTLIDLKKIVDLTVETIKQIMQLDRAGVLLIDHNSQPIRYRIAKVVGFNEKNGISLVQDNFLTQHLEKTRKPLVRDELILLSRDAKTKKEKESFDNLRLNMEHIEASLCLPIFVPNRIAGIIVLGAKISGDAYTVQDLEVLSTVALQAGIAINNAVLYKEVQDFSRNLEEKVKAQTKDLTEQAEHLKKLLEMRSEFLNIASHQLKTPISVILGTVSMFREGSMDKLSKAKQQKFLDNIFSKAKKLNVIINDILRASEVDTDNFTISAESLRPVDLVEMCKIIKDDLGREAQIKNLKVELLAPKGKPIMVMAEMDFLKQAIANLVDNAIKYTQNGSVKIELSRIADQAVIKVIDTGIGIPKSDQERIFGKFSRAINAVDMYADGSGLGLFVVKKVIQAHPGGKITFSSKLGKGTEFVVNLKAIG